MRLDKAGIAALIPHAGAMCLLDEVTSWDATRVNALCRTHRDADNPLRSGGRLHTLSAIEYAAQAMAVHGALMDNTAGATQGRRGMLAAVRDVRLNVERLDDIADDLIVTARPLIVEDGRLLYEFALHAGGRELVTGRAAVVLGTDRAA
jgi:predicted hotdog family 3-hydroxylacyl-ACP dehydratase